MIDGYVEIAHFRKKSIFAKKSKIDLFCRCCTHTKGTPLDDFYDPTSRGVVDIDQKPLNSYWPGMSPRGDIRRPFYTGFEKYTGFKNGNGNGNRKGFNVVFGSPLITRMLIS